MHAGYRRACGAAVHASVHVRSSRLAGAIRANHMQSVAISGNQPQLTSPTRFPTLSIP